MALDLNEVEKYKEFYGRNTAKMPLLVAEGRAPLSIADLMERRVNSSKPDWFTNYFFTGDAIAYAPNGNVKVVLDSQTLRQINPDSELNGGALVLTEEAYNKLSGTKVYAFKAKDLKRMPFEKDLTSDQVKNHPIWQALARDQSLLDAYVDKTFAEAEAKHNYNTNMGVYLDSAGDTHKLRVGVVSWLDNGSQLDGRYSLVNDGGRLVGVAPEAPNASGIVIPSLEQALAIVRSNKGKLDFTLTAK